MKNLLHKWSKDSLFCLVCGANKLYWNTRYKTYWCKPKQTANETGAKIPSISDRKLVEDLLKNADFKNMITERVGKYNVKMNWAKGTISFVGKIETANMSLETILKEIKNPTKGPTEDDAEKSKKEITIDGE